MHAVLVAWPQGGIRLVEGAGGGPPTWAAHLAYEGPANQRKGRADLLSKVSVCLCFAYILRSV